MSDLVNSIRDRYEETLGRIASSAQEAGRDPDSVKLVVVTKTQPVEVVQAAIEAGAKYLGENYPEEGVMKIQFLGPQSGVEWHQIGHIQSRKAKLVVAHFDVVQSLDGLKLAERLSRFSSEANRTLPVLLEFNVGGEESKSGWDASNEETWQNLFSDVESIIALPNLQVRGLMTMPPLESEPKLSKIYFRKLARLRDVMARHFSQSSARWDELSMGTSTDYEAAVREGATLVRVGTKIVGARHYSKPA
jgi:pyridoxal phosphate enzyme (YggS family)